MRIIPFINPAGSDKSISGSTAPNSTVVVPRLGGLISILFILLTSTASSVWALKPSETPLQHKLHHNLSVDDIARQINQRQQWRILAAEPTVDDAKTLYRFKLLNKQRGRVKVIVIDPSEPNLNKLNQ